MYNERRWKKFEIVSFFFLFFLIYLIFFFFFLLFLKKPNFWERTHSPSCFFSKWGKKKRFHSGTESPNDCLGQDEGEARSMGGTHWERCTWVEPAGEVPWHSPTLGHHAFTGPRASPPTYDEIGHPLLHRQLEPWVPAFVLFGWWFSPWELLGYWLVHIVVSPMTLSTPSAP